MSMTENLKNGVPVHVPNPSGFVAQKSGPKTNLPATPAGGDEKQVFPVRCNDKEEMPFGGVMASGCARCLAGRDDLNHCDVPGREIRLDGADQGWGLHGRDQVIEKALLVRLERALRCRFGVPVVGGRARASTGACSTVVAAILRRSKNA